MGYAGKNEWSLGVEHLVSVGEGILVLRRRTLRLLATERAPFPISLELHQRRELGIEVKLRSETAKLEASPTTQDLSNFPNLLANVELEV